MKKLLFVVLLLGAICGVAHAQKGSSVDIDLKTTGDAALSNDLNEYLERKLDRSDIVRRVQKNGSYQFDVSVKKSVFGPYIIVALLLRSVEGRDKAREHVLVVTYINEATTRQGISSILDGVADEFVSEIVRVK